MKHHLFEVLVFAAPGFFCFFFSLSDAFKTGVVIFSCDACGGLLSLVSNLEILLRKLFSCALTLRKGYRAKKTNGI